MLGGRALSQPNLACYGGRVVRKLEHYLADQARRDADDRNLVSRTEERRESQRVEAELLALATKLTQLKHGRLEQLGLSEDCLEIIAELRVIESPPARNRALKRLRAELRYADVEQLKRTLDALSDPRTPQRRDAADVWCDRLLGGNDAALSEFVAEHPRANRSQLRTLLRNRLRAKGSETKRAQDRLLSAIREAMHATPNTETSAPEESASPESHQPATVTSPTE